MNQIGVVERMELYHVLRVAGNLVQFPDLSNSKVQSPWAAVRGGYVSSVVRGPTRC
jgi:hypothetical protein